MLAFAFQRVVRELNRWPEIKAQRNIVKHHGKNTTRGHAGSGTHRQ